MPDDKEVDCAWIDFGQIAGIGRENNWIDKNWLKKESAEGNKGKKQEKKECSRQEGEVESLLSIFLFYNLHSELTSTEKNGWELQTDGQ